MRNYIVTGACGHLGQHIIRLLRETNCRIFGLILPNEAATSDEKTGYFSGDITKPSTLDAVFRAAASPDTVVIHTAGIVSISSDFSQTMFDVNVNGTVNVVKKCFAYHISRLVYVSSVHAIPEKPKGEVITEIDTFNPDAVIGAYAKTKAAASSIVLDAARSGLDAVIVHPSGILGSGGSISNHVNQFIFDYINGRLLAGVRGGYDFVDVRDAAQGCILAAEKGRVGECYILSGTYHTIGELLELLRKETGGRKLSALPIWLAKIFAPLFELNARLHHSRPLFTRYSLYTLESNAIFLHEKATRELGYQPRDITITIREMLQNRQ